MGSEQTLEVSYADVMTAAHALAGRWSLQAASAQLSGVYGVPRGGLVPAALVAGMLGLPLLHHPGKRGLVVDDLIDSGATAKRFDGHHFDALFRKSWSPGKAGAFLSDRWLVFPWEQETGELEPTDAALRLLQYIGEDPTRDGLVDTPRRMVKALGEMTDGYKQDPASILSRTFDVAYDEMVVVRDITFTSLCEHHVLTFAGTCDVAYVPIERVVGLSKIPRLVEAFAHRLQVQERLTTQIAEALDEHLKPLGVGVVIRARHSCMGCRGIRQPLAEMVTSKLLGLFKDDPRARAEFLGLTG